MLETIKEEFHDEIKIEEVHLDIKEEEPNENTIQLEIKDEIKKEDVKEEIKRELREAVVKKRSRLKSGKTDKNRHVCKECSYTTHSKSLYEWHVLIHATNERGGPAAKVLKCPKCTYKTNQKYLYDSHILIHKPRQNNESHAYTCPQCTFATNFRAELAKHKRSVHVQVYRCRKCEYTTPYRHNFNTHAAIHYRYLCMRRGCKYRARSKTILLEHVQEVHVDRLPEPLTCHECTFTCATKYTLVCHMQAHANRPIVCGVCDLPLKTELEHDWHVQNEHCSSQVIELV